MFKYNNTHIFTGYLKQLLSSVNIPACKIYTKEFAEYLIAHGKEDPRVIESIDSVAYNDVEKRLATHVSYLKNDEVYGYFWPYEDFAKNNDPELGHDNSVWKKTSNVFYDSEDAIHGLTKTLNSNGIFYDKVTHEYLGEYLRFLRDYHNINLMSLYNCYNDFICNNIYLNTRISGKELIFDSKDPNYRIYAIPVKLFEDYTIAIDSFAGLELFCGFYNTKLDASKKGIELISSTYHKENSSFFKQPFLYDKLNVKNWSYKNDLIKASDNKTVLIKTKNLTRWDIVNREQDLKLFLKVPVSCTSSIVILEGDFRNYNNSRFSIIKNKNLFMDNCTVGLRVTELGKKHKDLFEYKTVVCNTFYCEPSERTNEEIPEILAKTNAIIPTIEYYDNKNLSDGKIQIWDGSTITKPKYLKEKGYCEISTGAELAYIVKNGGLTAIDNLEIRNYKLINDIFLNDPSKIKWTNSTLEQSQAADKYVGSTLDNEYAIRKWFDSDDVKPFYGTIDGSYFTVHGLYANSDSDVGLLPKISADEPINIVNLGINHAYIKGANATAFIGALYKDPNKAKVTTNWQYQHNHSIVNFGSSYDENKVDTNASGFKPISKLQLLEYNTGESYPFADRLVEYLSGSAITPVDQISDNIKRAQHVMNDNNHYFKIQGIWEDKMQKIIYDYIINSGPIEVENDELVDRRRGYHNTIGHNSKSMLFDTLGYIDKDAEKWYASWYIAKNETKNVKTAIKNNIQNVDIYGGLYDI